MNKNFDRHIYNCSNYTFQLIASKHELVANLDKINYFLLNKAEHHSFYHNPKYLLAEFERKSSLKPFVLLITSKQEVLCFVPGFITIQPFNLQLSIIKLPSPLVKTLNLNGVGLIFNKAADKKKCTQIFFQIIKNFKEQISLIALNEIPLTSYLWKYASTHYQIPSSDIFLSIASSKIEIISWHQLNESYDEWYRSLRSKTRKRISWEKNRFQKRAPSPIKISRIVDKSQVAPFIQQVLKIRKESWQGKTFKIAVNLEKEIRFFERLAENHWLRSYILMCGGHPLAYELAVQYAGQCSFMERGYSQKFYKLSPGTFLTYHILEDCYNFMPPRIINFGFGENNFKKRMRTDSIEACYAHLTISQNWRMMVKLQECLNFLENKINILLKKSKLDNKVRKVLKRKK